MTLFVLCDPALRLIAEFPGHAEARAGQDARGYPTMILPADAYRSRLRESKLKLVADFFPEALAALGEVLERHGGLAVQRWRELDAVHLKDKAASHLRKALGRSHGEDHATHGAIRALMLLQRLAEDKLP